MDYYVELNLSEQMDYAKSKAWQTRISFAKYPTILPEVADFMIENESDPKIFSGICQRLFEKSDSNLWPSTLSKAARKKVELIGINQQFDYALVNIALHLNTDIDTLQYLYGLNDKHIGWGLANNPNTPKAILTELAKVNYFDIDDALLSNPNTPEEIKTMIRKRYPDGFFSCGYYYELKGIKVKASGN
ncbi:MAG: hypothetical protein E7314_00720 [Clostridiales bacterium]|nr:hypothetical protein [Clostridiales bacterium]